jgi:CRISPR-associated protein Cmr6
MRPLYAELTSSKVDWQGGNTGLWYDKFCNEWKSDWSGLEEEGKKNWIDTVANKLWGDLKQLEQATSRMTRLLEHHQQTPLYYRLESDFVTGLGREHPVENGFAWHHTLGTPYLPGSSVKGMVRAWAEQWTDTSLEDIRRIFGPGSEDLKNNKNLKSSVGSVVFLDALPQKRVQLKADVMTPHYGPYYQDSSGKTPPADWHSPNPIPFLVVEKDQTFVFGLLPRRNNEQGQKDCEAVKGWLKEALCWTGAGAKTAVGYGRFAVDEKAQAEAEVEQIKREKEAQLQAEQQQREAEFRQQTEGKSELYAELLWQSRQNRWTEPAGKDNFAHMGVIEDWLKKLEVNPQADASQYLATLIRQHFPRLLDNPNAMGGKKNDKPVFKERQQKFANRLLALLESMR